MGLLVKGMTLSTSPSSGINLKEQIKDLMYVNRVEVSATCIRPYQGDWYTGLGTQTLATEKPSFKVAFMQKTLQNYL